MGRGGGAQGRRGYEEGVGAPRHGVLGLQRPHGLQQVHRAQQRLLAVHGDETVRRALSGGGDLEMYGAYL